MEDLYLNDEEEEQLMAKNEMEREMILDKRRDQAEKTKFKYEK